MFKHMVFATFAISMAVSSAASAATFNVILDTDTVDGSGIITIDDALIFSNAAVNYRDPLVSVSLSFNGVTYDTPTDDTPLGGDTVFIFDALGQEIVAVDDQTPAGSVFTDFSASTDPNLLLAFDDGPVPGTFTTIDISAGLDNAVFGLRGTFSIERVAVSEVPLPASAFLLLGGLVGLAGFRRLKKA